MLLVDDDAALRELMVEAVQRGGYVVDVAANGQEALQRIEQHEYDLVLSDLDMPEMDGPALYRAIERAFPRYAARIAFMTAHGTAEKYSTFVRDVRAPVLRKPFHRAEFVETVARMIGTASLGPRRG